jgi:hypothetical protein
MHSDKLLAMSDDMEVLSLCLLKGGRKVAAGLQDGVIAMVSWGNWGDCPDRSRSAAAASCLTSTSPSPFRSPRPLRHIDALIAVNANMACTGSSGGLVRHISIHPNTLLRPPLLPPLPP